MATTFPGALMDMGWLNSYSIPMTRLTTPSVMDTAIPPSGYPATRTTLCAAGTCRGEEPGSAGHPAVDSGHFLTPDRVHKILSTLFRM